MKLKTKPYALHCVWNIDLSITIYCRRKAIYKVSGYDVRECAQAFIDGWFAGHEHEVRWSYPSSKKEAA